MARQRMLLLAVAALGACALGATGVRGLSTAASNSRERTVTTFTRIGTGDWSDPSNWNDGMGVATRYPGQGVFDDIVMIPGGSLTVDVNVKVGEIHTTTSAVGLTIASGRTVTTGALDVGADLNLSGNNPATDAMIVEEADGLIVQSSKILTLVTHVQLVLSGNAAGPTDKHLINGQLTLAQADTTLKIDNGATNAQAIFGGSGSLVGEDPDATIEITTASQDGLISEITISGALTFTGNGQFSNQGSVRAGLVSSGQVIDFDTTLVISDAAGDRWFASNSSTLQFDRDFTLVGHFLYDGGSFAFSAPSTCYVTTGGIFEQGVGRKTSAEVFRLTSQAVPDSLSRTSLA